MMGNALIGSVTLIPKTSNTQLTIDLSDFTEIEGWPFEKDPEIETGYLKILRQYRYEDKDKDFRVLVRSTMSIEGDLGIAIFGNNCGINYSNVGFEEK